jgi:hypothetical protein
MKKALAVLASSIALLGSQTAMASEAYVAPDASTPWLFQGTVTVSKGITLTCNVDLTISGPNNAADTPSAPFSHTDVDNLSATITLSGGLFGLCSSVVVAPISAGNISYTRTSDTSGTFALSNVFVTTITPGNCQGTIYGAWSQGGTSTLGVSGTLPAVSGSDCTMNGSLNLIDPADGDVHAPGDANHDPHQI